MHQSSRAKLSVLFFSLLGCGSNPTAMLQDGSAQGPPHGADAATGGSADAGPLGAGADGPGAPDAGGGPAPSHFATLPPHAALPTEAQCAAWVSAQPTPEKMMVNDAANHTTPTSNWLTAFYTHPDTDLSANGGAPDVMRITGNYTGSTDMILRWAACKWGIDEDIARAEAWEESSWRMSLHADTGTGAACTSANVPAGAPNYWSEPSPCQPSRGILQVRLTYFNAYPYADTSTALNADYRMARQRICMNGGIPWFVGQTTTDFGAYPPTTTDNALYGCMNSWFSGGWVNDGGYVSQLKTITTNQPWPH